ncbi:MAG: hypothetical protein UR66_C0013G0001, partial [Candidatus Moranbacteria bacterium GW2011_GWE1_35_17]
DEENREEYNFNFKIPISNDEINK